MKFQRLVAGGLAAAVALTVGVLPSEASADVINGCPLGSFCGWEDVMYSGRLQVDDLATATRPAVYHFGVSSYWNRTNLDLCAFMKDAPSRGRVIRRGEQSSLLDGGWNDNIGSISPLDVMMPGFPCS
jgi:hypothetical protein